MYLCKMFINQIEMPVGGTGAVAFDKVYWDFKKET